MAKLSSALAHLKSLDIAPLNELVDNSRELVSALASLKHTIAFDSKDYSANHRDFWLYGVLVGWDSEVAHKQGKKLGIPESEIDRMQRYNKAIRYFQWSK